MTHELPENNNEKKIICIFDKKYIEMLLSMILTDNPDYIKNHKSKSDKYYLKIKALTDEIIKIETLNPIMISDNKHTQIIEKAKAFNKYYKQAIINIKQRKENNLILKKEKK